MQTVTTVGLDIAKSVFQVHCVDAAGQVVIRRQLKRRYVLAFLQKLPPCLIGIEACASSHHGEAEEDLGPMEALSGWLPRLRVSRLVAGLLIALSVVAGYVLASWWFGAED